MRTKIKQLAGMASLTAVLILSGCNKDHVSSVKPHKVNEDNSKTLHCSAWEDVADPSAAVTDLNAVALCNSTTCDGTQSDFSRTGNIVRDSAGNIMYFDPLSTVTIADQNTIWNYAVYFASSGGNKPPGYFVSSISFSTQTVTVGSGIFQTLTNTFTFDVLYRKCTSGGGPQG